VATLNSSDLALPETISTCRFAQRVANVQTFARVNEQQDPQLVIASLRQENAQLKAAIGGQGGEALSEEELRKHCQSFLEDESSTSSPSIFSVASLMEAFAAFRMLRELCWEMLRRRLVSRATWQRQPEKAKRRQERQTRMDSPSSKRRWRIARQNAAPCARRWQRSQSGRRGATCGSALRRPPSPSNRTCPAACKRLS
ncbi:unnamed protein product, partial [Durusdinium trenchii]